MPSSQPPVVRWDELGGSLGVPGVSAAVAGGEQLSAALYRLEPGAVVPEHSHPNEEFGQVLGGSLELGCEGRTQVVGEGEAFLIPGGVPHSARALEHGCELLECYAPPRIPSPAKEATT